MNSCFLYYLRITFVSVNYWLCYLNSRKFHSQAYIQVDGRKNKTGTQLNNRGEHICKFKVNKIICLIFHSNMPTNVSTNENKNHCTFILISLLTSECGDGTLCTKLCGSSESKCVRLLDFSYKKKKERKNKQTGAKRNRNERSVDTRQQRSKNRFKKRTTKKPV